MTAIGARRQAERRGKWAETLACWWLRLHGYRILSRGYRMPQGEIDIVARRGRVVAFVEVKARRDDETAAYALGGRQRRRIAAAARGFIAGRAGLVSCDIRFDAVLIVPGRLPRHYRGAWEAM